MDYDLEIHLKSQDVKLVKENKSEYDHIQPKDSQFSTL